MRSDEWILVEDAFTETVSVSSLHESISDLASSIIQISELKSMDILLNDQSLSGQQGICACAGDFEDAQETPTPTTGVLLVSEPADEEEDFSSFRFLTDNELRGTNRTFAVLNIISPRIDPELGRLAAPKLRAGNLVGCIYKPDLEAVRVSQRVRERASLLLKAH